MALNKLVPGLKGAFSVVLAVEKGNAKDIQSLGMSRFSGKGSPEFDDRFIHPSALQQRTAAIGSDINVIGTNFERPRVESGGFRKVALVIPDIAQFP